MRDAPLRESVIGTERSLPVVGWPERPRRSAFKHLTTKKQKTAIFGGFLTDDKPNLRVAEGGNPYKGNEQYQRL